jgi:hypothetical protein
MENNKQMKLDSPVCLVNNKLMKLDFMGVWQITDKWRCITLGVWKKNKQMVLYSPWCMDNNKQMELYSMGVW